MAKKEISFEGTIQRGILLVNPIIVDFDSAKSIKKAEKKKKKLENTGWNLKNTKQMGLNKFKMIYEKKLKRVV
jgi:hypothetical protein